MAKAKAKTQGEVNKGNLKKANTLRTEAAKVKKALRSGERDGAETLLNPPPSILKMEVFDFLTLLPKVGPAAARRVMRGAVFAPTQTLEETNEHTRAQLARHLRDRVAGPRVESRDEPEA